MPASFLVDHEVFVAYRPDFEAAVAFGSGPRTPEPCAIVIFGAFGDLAERLVMLADRSDTDDSVWS